MPDASDPDGCARRISEIVGADAVNLDTRMRTLGFHRQAGGHLKILNDETINYLRQYVAGINAFINDGKDSHPLEFTLGGITPENWASVDVVAIMYYMGRSLLLPWSRCLLSCPGYLWQLFAPFKFFRLSG